jgi:hypothetical protein
MTCRPDPIGDLARDVQASMRVLKWDFPAHPKKVEQVLAAMWVHAACPEALAAARDAWEEFELYEGGGRAVWTK